MMINAISVTVNDIYIHIYESPTLIIILIMTRMLHWIIRTCINAQDTCHHVLTTPFVSI